MGGTPPPSDFGLENYARLAAACAADLGCDVVVGHSIGANVALEMVGSGLFKGPAVLLCPSLSRTDEAMVLRALDRLTGVLGHWPYAAMIGVFGAAMKHMPLPVGRRDVPAAEFAKNDPRVTRRMMRSYLTYLDRDGSVASRLCDAGVPAWVVHGERDDGGLTDDERRTLEACPRTQVITIPGASYFTQIEHPALVAELVVKAIAELP
jgi:pimeloyl-ACP methyl ester carboxylesterase